MSVINIVTDTAGQIGVQPRIVKLQTTDSYATITASNYLAGAIAEGFNFYPTDILAVTYDTNVSQLFVLSITNNSITMSPINQSTNYPIVNTTTEATATPGTVRSITGKITNSISVMTSGNLVGVRGEVDVVGASGGFLYGTQGKVIGTGTFSGSVWVAGVFGQFDLSAATPGAAQFATLWGDYGTSATAGTYTGARGIAMTNTTAAILNAQLYLYGAATNLLELDDNHGLSGATYFVAAGTGTGSWGHSTVPPATFVLKITVNGTSYWLPLASSNS